MGRHEEWRLA
jgi:hypothetical protein